MKNIQEQMPTAGRTLQHYFRVLKTKKRYVIPILLILPTVTVIGSYISPLVVASIINRITTETFAPEQLLPIFGPLIALFIGLRVISELILWRLAVYLDWKLETLVRNDLSLICFDKLAEQSMHFHSNRFGGSLVSQVGKFTGAYSSIWNALVWNILTLVVSFAAIFIILGPQLPWFTLALAVMSAIFIIVAWFSFKAARPLSEKEAEASNKASGRLADAITNISAVKSHGHEAYEKQRYAKVNKKAVNAMMSVIKAVTKRDIGFGSVLVTINALFIIVLVFGNAWFGAGIGTLVLAMMYGQSLVSELWGVNRIFRDINRGFGDASEMTMILDEPTGVVDQPGAKKLQIAHGAVEFKDINFTHADGKDAVFENFSLKIKPGERVGLVGRSGSGKTTLTKLLLRFADVQNGNVLVDGQDVSKVTQESLRKNIAYVPQETLLFHRTIRENIAYGKLDASDEEVVKAAKLANAWEFIKGLPYGLKTLTGERGVKLSGGQRQRIAIARAILKDAPILVLDEATSALDSESEKLIQDALQKLMKNRTSIVVAHRLSTVAGLDRIVVLADGKVVEDGPHAELVKNDKEYAKLWNRQSGGFIEN
ncbi:MAG: ABC transporter ATP-binding protein/permease [Candidatus Nomurabacteria bacterium]|nr:ABC transporter ATP-binding protein/permease [Candidatus Nomurabacteria bacterium]